MTFIYILGSGSIYDDMEIRYSIRSVVKHHPDADIKIVGETPSWHTGEGIIYVEDDEIPAISKWKKMEVACTLADEFIQMDDDFILLAPYEPIVYKLNYTILQKAYMRGRGQTCFSKMIWATAEICPDEPCYLLHTPLPVHSDTFIKVSNMYKWDEAPSIAPKQMYCIHQDKYEVREKHDVKGYFPKDEHLWSLTPKLRRPEQLEEMLPYPSRWEKQV